MSDDTDLGDPVHAWALLCEHPALSWTPPVWRTMHGVVPAERIAPYVVRAVERNLVVDVRPGTSGSYVVALSTGPLEDRVMGDGVDPLAPSACRDVRLDVEADTFEAALCALARRVVDVFGPGDVVTSLRPDETAAWD